MECKPVSLEGMFVTGEWQIWNEVKKIRQYGMVILNEA
jgi:hypothetical protein